MAVTGPDVVWRPFVGIRVAVLVVFVPFVLLGLFGILLNPGNLLYYLVVAVLVASLVGELRRRCVLTASRIVAQGRFARREIPLADVRQVGEARDGSVWVQTRETLFNGDDVTMLRMIPVAKAAARGGVKVHAAVPLIRERAAANGAKLDRALTEPTRPPTSKVQLFSM